MGQRSERLSSYYNEHPAHIFLPIGIGGGLAIGAIVFVYGDHSHSALNVVVAIFAGLASVPLFMMILAVVIGLGGALAETIEKSRRRRR
jgi:hypothetical protein